jgi:diguanylate cyclase (GGDEF)-like protein
MAHYDALTNLPNRLLLQARLNHAISHAQRHRNKIAVIFFDLDRFKNINDSLGHPVGDELLRRVAARLQRCVRQDDTVARIGGDEFVLLLESLEHAENAAVVAAKVQHAFNKPFNLQEHSVHVSASMGICAFPGDGQDADTLLRNADAAMYRAKDEGRNTYRYYTEELTEHAFERVVMEGQLRDALRANGLYMVYQPQIDLLSGKVVGVEALMRWQSREFGMVSPRRFIPIAEESGLINELGEYALHSALHQASEWYRHGIDFGRMAINVAGTQLRHPDFIDIFFHQLDVSRLPAELLELEITEDFIMLEADKAVADLRRLQELGVSIAIDDFGTGYSSLAYLKQLPIAKLKIDQSFIQDIPQDPNDMAITRTIIALGRIMQLQVVAEGVETDAQRDFLIAEGCDQAQGFLFAHAEETAQIEHWLQRPDVSLH